MSVFAISDLHLSLGTNKPMDIFGWDNHVERIKSNWIRMVKETDTVVIPGDFSWALKLEESLEDFRFLDSLPGTKLLLKGNHDLWWSTVKKVNEFFEKNDIKTVKLIFNSAEVCDEFAICGTRGWLFSEAEDNKKIIAREAGRLRRSLETAVQTGKKPLVFTHYPVAYGEEYCTELIDILKEFSIDIVYYGHIHGNGFNNSIPEFDGIKLKLVSCDCMNFVPYLIK
ncbi:MAG: metallophosphoesterase [Clostridia bacterium]|nr:metallophosphoesterase [Clostridia bacterium]